jgi:PAS domain S-box-containing protein
MTDASAAVRTDGTTGVNGVNPGAAAMLDAVDLPIVVISHESKILHGNRAATTTLGLTPSDIGRSLGSIFPGDESIDRLCTQVFTDGVPCRREIRIGDRHFLFRIAPYVENNQKIVGTILTLTNVTAFRASIDQAVYEREYTKAILNTVMDPIVVLDASLRIQTANRAFYAMFAVSRDATQGTSITSLGDDAWKTSDAWEKVKLTLSDQTECQGVEIDRPLTDIGPQTIAIDACRLKREGADMILVAFRDITARKRAAQAIHNLNAQLSVDLAATARIQQLSTRMIELDDFTVLMEEILDAAVEVTNAEMGNIQLLEDGILRIIAQRGFTSDFLEFFNHVDAASSACGTAMCSGERVIVEDVTTSPIFAGTPALDVMLRAQARAVQSTPLVTRGGEMIGMLSTHYRLPHRPSERELRRLDILGRQTADVIERRRAERALRTSEERLRLAQKAAKIGVFEWDIQTDVNIWSADLEELHGLRPGSFGGTQAAWEALVHPQDREGALKLVEEALNTGMPVEGEWRVTWPDASVHWLAARFQVHRDAQGVPTRMRGVNFDLTDRKNIENALRRANEDLEQFAYSASHDLQEPLRSVKIFSDLLSMRYGNQLTNEALEFLGHVRDGAGRMDRLMRDLITYTQVATVGTDPEYVDANAAMQNAVANLEGAIAESGAKVEADPLPTVRAHHVQLQQVFQNLIGNAIKYHRQGIPPVIHTTARRQDTEWQFSVTDNGIGINPQFTERIFGLFKRLQTGDQYSGTGIGLALCQRIVERHHGRIWVESEEGKGSVFHFTLPV